MSNNATCCGCFGNIFGSIKGVRRRGRTYRRARYNEREYSIEFENLIEEDDFVPTRKFAVSDEERELLNKGKYDALIGHQSRTNAEIEAELTKQEEDLRLEEEAYYQAKEEAAKVSTQSKLRQTEKATAQSKRAFDSEEFTTWLSQENLEITSPELDVEDFDTFLEKVKARSLSAKNTKVAEVANVSSQLSLEATLNQGLEATQLADNALNALSPIDNDDDDDDSNILSIDAKSNIANVNENEDRDDVGLLQ
eukprot:gene11992-13231_t